MTDELRRSCALARDTQSRVGKPRSHTGCCLQRRLLFDRSIRRPMGEGGSSAFVASITEVDDDGVEERTQAQRYISQAPTAG